jgi:hypothetical protein
MRQTPARRISPQDGPAGVVALGVAATLFRVLMGLAGLTA